MHPVQFHAENVAPRSRLTTFFRLLLVIPHAIAVGLYGIAAYVVALVGWFAVLILGRYPRGMWDFVVGMLRYSQRVNAYLWLIADAFPPFGAGGAYTAELTIAYPERSSRLTALLRGLLAIPALILTYVLGLAGRIVGVIQWLAIVFSGRCPEGLHGFQCLVQRYTARTVAYVLCLVERYPSFEEGAVPAAAGASPWDAAP